MATTVGEVAVDFVANLDELFKSLEKLGKKLDEALSGKQEIKVSFDERVVAQIDKMADGVEKISNLTERFRLVAEGVFDSLDGKIGNTSEQIEKSFGGAIKGVGNQTDDFITDFLGKITKGLARLNPLVLGQLFGATLLIERLVASGFKITSILPKFVTQGAGAVGVVGGLVAAIKTLDIPYLLGFVLDVSQSLLSVTTVVALLTTGLRGLTGLALRFIGRRPETQVQKAVVLLETLNAGLTEMLATTKIFIERMFFITSGLTSVVGMVTILTSGVTGLTAVVSPFLAAAFLGISGIRLAAAKVSDWLLRFRAAAGDGRAQTTLFLRSLRQMFPILEAIARNAKPIAKMIDEFAKGGFSKRMKEVIGKFQTALSGISRIEAAIKNLAALLETTSGKVLKQMDHFISKADALFKKIGRQGARDALDSIERVQSAATKATKDVKQGIVNIAPAAQNAEKSVSRLGARLFEMGKRTLSLIGRTGTVGTGSLLGLMLFGSAGSVVPFLNPLTQFRDKLIGGFSGVTKKAGEAGDAVAEAFGSGAAVDAASQFMESLTSTLGGVLDIGVELSKKFWGVFVNPATLTQAFAFAGQTIAGLAPLLAIGFGAVLTPLVLRSVKNLTAASFGVIKATAGTVWPAVRKGLVEPVSNFLLFLPRKVKDFATKTVPDAVSKLTARVFKGTVAVGERVKQFFGLAELTEEQASEKASVALGKRTAGMREQRKELVGQIELLKRSAQFGEDEKARKDKLRQVEDRLVAARAKAADLERKIKGDLTVDPEGAKKKLAATREEIKRLAAEAGSLDAPFEEVQQRIIETETQLRSLTDTLAKEMSGAALQKLTQDIQKNSRPIRSAIANVGIDATKAFASGLKGTTSLVKAVLVSPFSSAATKRNMQAAATNLSKSFRSAFSVAMRIGGGIASMLGLKGLGAALKGRAGTTSGLTAGTPEEEAAKRKAAADIAAAKAQNELTDVLRAEKIVAEAAVKQKQLEQATSDLQINNQKLMSGEMEKTENVLREMTGSFQGLTSLANRLEEVTRNTVTRVGGFSETLDPADFQAAIALAREIDQALPNFKELRAQFERLADATGMDAKTREQHRLALDKAETQVKAALDERVESLIKLAGSDSNHIAKMREGLVALEAKAAADVKASDAENRLSLLRVKIAAAMQQKAELSGEGSSTAAIDKKIAVLRIEEAATTKEKASADRDAVADQERVIAQRLKLAAAMQAAETKLVAELIRQRHAVEASTINVKLHEATRDKFTQELEAAAKSVHSAAFVKFTKEIEQQTQILAGAKAGSKAAKDAQAKLANATENREKVIKRATADERDMLRAAQSKFKQHNAHVEQATEENKRLTKRLQEVSAVMLSSRSALTHLPNSVKSFAAAFDKVTKTAGTEYVSTLAAQADAGQELEVFTDKAAKALKAQVAEIELQKTVLKEETAAAEELLKTKKSSTAIQKELDAALKKSATREEQLAVLTKDAGGALEDVKVAEDEVATAAAVQEKAVKEGTAATRELSTQSLRVAGALEKAKLAIDEGGQAMKELATAADQTADTTKPTRQGARVGQGESGQLGDLVSLLLARLSPSEIEKAPLTPIRENAKNSPELRAIESLAGSEDALQGVLAILNEITQKPVERIGKLSDGFSNLIKLLKRLQENPERLAAFTKQFSPKTIGNLSRMVGLLDKMVGVVKKIQVPGGAGARGQMKGFESFALRTIGQLIEQGIVGAIDFSEIPKRLLAALRAEFQNVKIEFGDKGQQAIASELELAVRTAMQQVAGRLSARGNMGVKIAEQIAQGMASGADEISVAATTMLKPAAEQIEHKSPPRSGPLRAAELSMRNMGRTIGQQMMLGVNALKELTSQFMRQGFEGLLPAAFNAGASVADKLIGGVGRGLGKIANVLDKFSIPGKLLALPIRIAGSIVEALSLVTVGIAKIGAQVAGSVTSLVKETSTKLLKLGMDATRLRLDPNALQRFNEAVGILGGSASDAESGLQQLTQSIEQVARGSAPELEAAFADAGLSLKELQTLGSDEIFLRIAKAANEATGDIRKQSDLLRLIGADFSSLKGVVLQGADSIASAFEKANKNPPISQKTLELASKFTGVMSQIEQTIERIKIIVFEELAPILDDALESFGNDSRTQIDFILENIRTAVRIVINTILLVGKFINERYIQAGDGAEKLFADIVVAGRIAWNAIGDLLGVVLEHGADLAKAAFEAVWTALSGQAKSTLGKILIDVVSSFASLANLILSPFEAAWDFIKIGFERVWAGLKLGALGLLSGLGTAIQSFADHSLNPMVDLVNELMEFFESDFRLGRIDVTGGFDKQIKETKDEIAGLQRKDIPNFFDVVKKKFDETEKDIDRASKSLKDALDIKISSGEVDAFIDGLKGADNEAERLAATIQKLNKDGILKTELTGEETIAELRAALTKAASGGLIPPGAVSEGTERLRREAIKALGDVADETGLALKKAFEVGFDKLAQEFPEVVDLLKQIGIEGQRELDATAVRLANLRSEQQKLNKDVKSNLKTQHDVTLELVEQRRALEAFRKGFDLRRELQGLTDGFVGPFTEANRQVEELGIQMKEKILELKEGFKEFALTLDLDDQLAATIEMAKGLGLETTDAAGKLNELTAATLMLQDALNALADSTPENRAILQAQVNAAQARLAAAQAAAGQAVTGIQEDLTDGVSKGFEEGMRVAASKPIVNILRTNLVEPVLGAFKETIKGLVDGTLVEAAREAEKVAEQTGQKFSRALFIIADFGKRIFEQAFDTLLEKTFTDLTEGLTSSIQDAFKDAEGSASGLGDAAGSAIAAAITAAIALAGLILSRLQGEISATEEAVENIVDSSEAIRGVISGSTTVAIKEAEDAFRDAQRPIVVRLDTIIGLMRSAIGGGSMPSIPLSGAGSTAIP